MDFDFGTVIFIAAFLWFLFSEIRPKKKRGDGRSGGGAGNRRAAESPSRRLAETSRSYDDELERRRLERLLQGLEADPDPLVVSLETPEYTERPVIDQATETEALVRRRIEAARARDGALTEADHAAFDRRIRAAPPLRAHSSRHIVRPRRRPTMRDAVVWREILGPPVSLRDEQS